MHSIQIGILFWRTTDESAMESSSEIHAEENELNDGLVKDTNVAGTTYFY